MQQAKELEALLSENKIENSLIENKSSLDASFSSALLNDFEIKIKAEDFERAQLLVEEQAANMLNDIDKDYYLLSFTNEELYDIILKKDEWNEFDYLLARKLLTQRGKVVDDELLISIKNQRIKDLSKPEPHQKAWVFAGYLLAFLGGVIGVIIGYLLWRSQKTLPNGVKVYSYSKSERKHGLIIFSIGVFMFALSIMLQVFNFNAFRY